MSTTTIQEATTGHDCKTPDCPNEARSSVGRYSYCDFCRGEREKRAGKTATAVSTTGGYEQRARDLIAAGKALDKARAEAEKAMGRVRDAQARWELAQGALSASGNGDRS